MHGSGGGASMAGGVGACMAEGRAWQPPPRQILRDTVNERAVRILLECILVFDICVCI